MFCQEYKVNWIDIWITLTPNNSTKNCHFLRMHLGNKNLINIAKYLRHS